MGRGIRGPAPAAFGAASPAGFPASRLGIKKSVGEQRDAAFRHEPESQIDRPETDKDHGRIRRDKLADGIIGKPERANYCCRRGKKRRFRFEY